MYAYIQGTLTAAHPSFVIIDAGGVGYHILIPPRVFTHLPEQGKKVLIYTSFIVRDISQTLYGFLTQEDKNLFETLVAISGIGPKTALSIIGHMEQHDFQEALSSGRIEALCKIPGIGKKTGERLLLEMRDKVPKLSPAFPHSQTKNPRLQKIEDAMQALIHLGYSQANAEKAVKKGLQSQPEDLDVARLITESLRCL